MREVQSMLPEFRFPNPSVSFGDSSPFRGALRWSDDASPERGGACETGGGVTALLWGTAPIFPTAEYPEAPIYGRGVRVTPAAAGGCRPCRPAASGTGHCPAKTSAALIYGGR